MRKRTSEDFVKAREWKEGRKERGGDEWHPTGERRHRK